MWSAQVVPDDWPLSAPSPWPLLRSEDGFIMSSHLSAHTDNPSQGGGLCDGPQLTHPKSCSHVPRGQQFSTRIPYLLPPRATDQKESRRVLQIKTFFQEVLKLLVSSAAGASVGCPPTGIMTLNNVSSCLYVPGQVKVTCPPLGHGNMEQ